MSSVQCEFGNGKSQSLTMTGSFWQGLILVFGTHFSAAFSLYFAAPAMFIHSATLYPSPWTSLERFSDLQNEFFAAGLALFI